MNAEQGGILYLIFSVVGLSKLGCVVRMVVDSILPHAESGPNDHRKDAPRLKVSNHQSVIMLDHIGQTRFALH